MKLLIVEDDLGIAELITDALEDIIDNIYTKNTGAEAIEFVKNDKPDLLILDYSLPDMNARQIIERLRNQNVQIPPFLVSTGQGDENIAVEMMKLGAHDYVVKDTYLLNRIPDLVERSISDIEKDKKLRQAILAAEKSDKKLLEERARLANIIKASNVGTWEWNVQTDRAIFNNRWAEIVGYSLDELTPLTFDTWLNLVHPDDIKKSNEALQKHLSGEEDYYEMEVRMHHKEGHWVWVLTRGGITEWDANGKPLVLSGTHQDITDKKHSEVLEKEVAVAKEALRFKQNFLANMSHEIRTPLNGIVGMTEMLQKTKINNQQGDYINTLKNSAQLLTEIIDQVLDLSKIESGKVKLNLTSFDLIALLHNMLDFFKPLVNDKQVELILDIDHSLPKHIKADKKRISQVLQNLISNAIKFTEHGHVKISCKLVSSSNEDFLIKVFVEDTGVGIKKESKPLIFTPFALISESDIRSIDGTGLGLSISRELVKLHGGEMGFESQSGKGSVFWFNFLAKVPGNENTETTRKKINSNKPDTASLNILYVEDKVINQKVVGLLIESMGYKIELANNGREALEKYKPGTFDLILMDIQMPVMDGVTATKKLKEKYSKKHLPPIVGLSANAFEGDREKYLQDGLDEYLTKPFDSEEFEKVLNKYF